MATIQKMGAKAKSVVGKYVCYGNENGGFCWGKIKSETEVNTMKGWAGAYILSERKTCMGPPYTANRIMSHDKDTILLKQAINPSTDIVESRDMFGELTDDELFVVMMMGRVDRKVSSLIHTLINHGGDGIIAMVKEELEKRLK